MITLTELRLIGNLDEQVSDEIITVNLESSVQELKRLLNTADYSGLNKSEMNEAEACLTMSRLVTVLTIKFKTQQGLLEDVKTLKDYWESRAMKIINRYALTKIGFYAI